MNTFRISSRIILLNRLPPLNGRLSCSYMSTINNRLGLVNSLSICFVQQKRNDSTSSSWVNKMGSTLSDAPFTRFLEAQLVDLHDGLESFVVVA